MKAKKPDPKINEIELVPDAWPRFEKFFREIAKAGPQRRNAAVKKERPASKGGIAMTIVC